MIYLNFTYSILKLKNGKYLNKNQMNYILNVKKTLLLIKFKIKYFYSEVKNIRMNKKHFIMNYGNYFLRKSLNFHGN